MNSSRKNIRKCPNGHQYYKSSDCPTCPVCEKERKTEQGFFPQIPAPARRALESKGITNVHKLSGFSENEILVLHGMGSGSIHKLRKALASEGLAFRENTSKIQ